MRNASNLAVVPVDRSRVADQIFKDLRDSILLGTIPHGAKLPAERELAQHYQVSGPTVREAIRALALIGLVDARHGSGTFVTANPDVLVALSLSAVIQLGKLGAAEVLSVAGVLNEHAARLAADAATPEDHACLRAALGKLDAVESAQTAADAVRYFHGAIAAAAHNPLLSGLCRFLTDLQISFVNELAHDSIGQWRKISAGLKPLRIGLIQAIIDRDADLSAATSREFHLKAVKLFTPLPSTRKARIKDPKLDQLLSAIMMSRP
ncbi:MAG TPA: GntR family transcriptional regulator [Bradyrhizobium sp.]|nr:GntR family transcriptional regulator [Bradyrhizobium sp.]